MWICGKLTLRKVSQSLLCTCNMACVSDYFVSIEGGQERETWKIFQKEIKKDCQREFKLC